jgi:hypothetical protein
MQLSRRTVVALALAGSFAAAPLAFASDIATTPSVGRVGGGSGQPCVFVGSATVGNPLSNPTLVRTDPRTGAYQHCPY